MNFYFCFGLLLMGVACILLCLNVVLNLLDFDLLTLCLCCLVYLV